MQNAIELAAGGDNVKRLPLQVPEKYNSSIVILTKLGLVAWVASVIGKYTGVSGAIWALILGVIFCTLGFLDRDSLHKANSFNIMMLGLICFVFDGLKDMTPELLFGMIGPMIGFIIVGVAGMTLFAFVASKILHRSFFLCFANASPRSTVSRSIRSSRITPARPSRRPVKSTISSWGNSSPR